MDIFTDEELEYLLNRTDEDIKKDKEDNKGN
jgi:hypothetical protein